MSRLDIFSSCCPGMSSLSLSGFNDSHVLVSIASMCGSYRRESPPNSKAWPAWLCSALSSHYLSWNLVPSGSLINICSCLAWYGGACLESQLLEGQKYKDYSLRRAQKRYWDPISKQNKSKRAWGEVQMVGCLPSKCEALGAIPRATGIFVHWICKFIL
jgi:hypothetical protein